MILNFKTRRRPERERKWASRNARRVTYITYAKYIIVTNHCWQHIPRAHTGLIIILLYFIDTHDFLSSDAQKSKTTSLATADKQIVQYTYCRL